MSNKLQDLFDHQVSEDCTVCRAQDFVYAVVTPAVASWELQNSFPQFSLALNSAAALLGAMLEEGISRTEIDEAVAALLDDIERQVAEEGVLGGPTQGSA